MSNETVVLRICVATLLAVAMVAMPVSSAGSGKLAVPGTAGSWTYGGSTWDAPRDIAATRDGGLVLAGESNSIDHDLAGVPFMGGPSDVWVLKLDASHVVEWSRRYGGSKTDTPSMVQQTADGGYIFIADTFSSDGNVSQFYGNSSTDIWVVKLTETGTLDWERCYGGNHTDFGSDIQQTSDSGFILCGYTSSVDGDVTGHHGPEGQKDAWVIKIGPTGAIEWQKCLGGSNEDSGGAIIQTRDGGYLMSGSTKSNDGYITSHHGAAGVGDTWLVKLSEDGMVMWQKCLGGSGSEGGGSVLQTADDGFIIAAATASTDGDVSGNHDSTGATYDAWVVRTDATGGIVWQKCIGGTGDENIGKILPATGGGYLFVGNTESDNDDVSSPYRPTNTDPDAWVVRLNSAGSPLWQKCLGGTGYDVGSGIVDAADGGHLVAVQTLSTDGEASIHYGNWDALLVKLNGPPLLTGIAPTQVALADLPRSIVITGEDLDLSSVVRLSRDGSPFVILLPGPGFPSGTTLLPCIEAGTVTPGTYTVRVTGPDGQWAELPDALTITCGPAPKITSVTPTSGQQGETVLLMTIKGSNFATVALGGVKDIRFNRTGRPDILATNLTTVSATQLTCKVVVPAGAEVAKWNLVVRNPDGQYAVKANAFSVKAKTVRPPRVNAVTPRRVKTGQPVFLNAIMGSAFNESVSVAITGPRGMVIAVSNVTVQSATRISCDADLTGVPKGYATVTVTNPDGKKGMRARALALK